MDIATRIYYLNLLGIDDVDASIKEIKKAYRRMSMKFHPDRNNGSKTSEEKFKQISEAWEVLKKSSEIVRPGWMANQNKAAKSQSMGFQFKHVTIEVSVKDILESSTIEIPVPNDYISITLPGYLPRWPLQYDNFIINIKTSPVDRFWNGYEWNGYTSIGEGGFIPVTVANDFDIKISKDLHNQFKSQPGTYDMQLPHIATPYGTRYNVRTCLIDANEQNILVPNAGFKCESFVPTLITPSYLLIKYTI